MIGNFKDAIPGGAHSYCIDLRFWYPGADYRYKEDTSGSLANKDGDAVPLPNQQRIAYATWVYGRSSDPDQAAAGRRWGARRTCISWYRRPRCGRHWPRR